MTHRSGCALLLSVAAWLACSSEPSSTQSGKTGEAHGAPATETGPVAQVKTVPLRKGEIREDITVYGSIIPAPGAVQTVSVAFESHVVHVMVSDGQRVSRGEVLLEIEPSPDTYLHLEEARSARELERQALQHTQQRFDLKLATNDQLLRAKESFKQAELRLRSLEERGIDGRRKIRADFEGLSSRVNVQPGAIVLAGDALVQMVSQDHLEARLEVEPEDIQALRTEQPVTLSYVNVPGESTISGRIRKISRSVNPSTRLIDVFVLLPSSTDFLLGEMVVGTIAIASARGWVVPRSCVLPADGRFVLYTVKDGRASRHIVDVGLENEKEVEVFSKDLQAGDRVVALGNYELSDGMSVQVVGSP